MPAEATVQADVGPGDETGIYYITICNVLSLTPIMTCATLTKLTTLSVAIRNFLAGVERLDTYSMRGGPYRGLPEQYLRMGQSPGKREL
jgi:hypothetical protein